MRKRIEVLRIGKGLNDDQKEEVNELMETMDRVIPNLYIGGIEASYPQPLLYFGIEVILNCTIHEQEYKVDGIAQKWFKLNDDEEQNICGCFDDAYKTIDDALTAKKKVLVHCQQGVSRSGTIVIMYIMKKRSMNFEDAFALVKK